MSENSYLFYTLKHQKTAYEFVNESSNDSGILGGFGFFETSSTEDSSVWQQWNNSLGIGGKLLGQRLLFQSSFESGTESSIEEGTVPIRLKAKS